MGRHEISFKQIYTVLVEERSNLRCISEVGVIVDHKLILNLFFLRPTFIVTDSFACIILLNSEDNCICLISSFKTRSN